MTLFREQERVAYCKLKLCWSWFGCLLEMETLYNSAAAVCPEPQLSLELVFLAKWNLPLANWILFQAFWSLVWPFSALTSPCQLLQGPLLCASALPAHVLDEVVLLGAVSTCGRILCENKSPSKVTYVLNCLPCIGLWQTQRSFTPVPSSASGLRRMSAVFGFCWLLVEKSAEGSR